MNRTTDSFALQATPSRTREPKGTVHQPDTCAAARSAADAPKRSADSDRPEVSIVIPTRNEAGNIEPLVMRLQRALAGRTFEIIFVDDSDDATTDEIEAVQQRAADQVRLVHRPRGQRRGGLAGAVVLGLEAARAPWACVMDADLQHPPEVVPQLLTAARQRKADLVVASRYCADSALTRFSRLRAAVSRLSTTIAQLAFPRRLEHVTDPLSGFFLLRRAAVDLGRLRPQGFKILLEILVRHPDLRVVEVGYVFGARQAGESKATVGEGLRYLALVTRLRCEVGGLRLARFLLVGGSGIAVNSFVLAAATELLALHYLLSAVLATWASTMWNFWLTELWVFPDRHDRRGWVPRLGRFTLVNNAALLLRGPVIYVLTSVLFIHYLVSNLISLGLLSLIRFALADVWIWKGQRRMPATFNYDIHRILTVSSDVRLPELEPFRVDEPIPRPDIRVRIGRRQAMPSDRETKRMRYAELPGSLGFALEVAKGETINVAVSPLLRYSPHVLYTNVVEPILRWTFVERGYALVHGGCFTVGDRAYLITARTDTGKTTTMLHLLSQQRLGGAEIAFLADDLTLLTPDGRVLAYPKPLTVSRHTVAAINPAALTRTQRLKLWYQSRVHSRACRRLALRLAGGTLPMATVNALVQLLVPPPKYAIQQLIPAARVVPEAWLAGVFFIERGGEEEYTLDPSQAVEQLMCNSADAYGFPPYSALEPFLCRTEAVDLRARERQIVARALGERPARCIRRRSMDWARRIAELVESPERTRTALPYPAAHGAVPGQVAHALRAQELGCSTWGDRV